LAVWPSLIGMTVWHAADLDANFPADDVSFVCCSSAFSKKCLAWTTEGWFPIVGSMSSKAAVAILTFSTGVLKT
jgi:hypothetical protein